MKIYREEVFIKNQILRYKSYSDSVSRYLVIDVTIDGYLLQYNGSEYAVEVERENVHKLLELDV